MVATVTGEFYSDTLQFFQRTGMKLLDANNFLFKQYEVARYIVQEATNLLESMLLDQPF